MKTDNEKPADDHDDAIQDTPANSGSPDNPTVPFNSTPSHKSMEDNDDEETAGRMIEPEPDKIVVGGGGKLPPISSTSAGPAPDPFDPAHLRLSQDFGASLGVKKALITVPVRKPSKECFIQVHPGEEFRIQTCVIELKDDREIYLVERALWPELVGEATFGPRALFTAMTRQGVVFVWPIRLPGPDGRLDSWNESALEAAKLADGQWVRIAANMHLGAYDVAVATAPIPPPAWPEISFKELLRVAFKGRYIDTMDHIVLRKLRGEI
jgi:hypothetical protein